MAAVSNMAVCCRASVLALCFHVYFLQVLVQGQVFLRAPQAHGVLLRPRRANMFLLEELLQGDLERECYEEKCSFEEAREVFENTETTVSFWTVYQDGDQCEPNPCLHGGNCTDRVGGFLCSCPAPYSRPICGQVDGVKPPPTSKAREIAECPTGGPTACHQLCTASYGSFTCSCATGFKLQSDKRSCLPEGEFTCGRLPDNATASTGCHGICPWQVWVLNSQGAELCGGVVLGRRSILTSARCLVLDSGSDLRASRFFVVAGNNRMPRPIWALQIHKHFRLDDQNNDLALLELARPLHFGPSLFHVCLPTKEFSENILMQSGRRGVAGGRGGGRNQELVYKTLDECRGTSSVSLSNKMFCMRSLQGAEPRHAPTPGPSLNRRRDRPPRKQDGRQNLDGQRGHQGAQIGAQNKNSSTLSNEDQRPSEAGSRGRCRGSLPGSPVATVDRGTAFLTGLRILAPAAGDAVVFTKLSRYLNWIRPRLEAAEDRMTPQVSVFPAAR